MIDINKEIAKLRKSLAGDEGGKHESKCDKKRYETKKQAKRALRRSRNWYKKPLQDCYECEYCGGWHTTSKNNKSFWRNKKQ